MGDWEQRHDRFEIGASSLGVPLISLMAWRQDPDTWQPRNEIVRSWPVCLYVIMGGCVGVEATPGPPGWGAMKGRTSNSILPSEGWVSFKKEVLKRKRPRLWWHELGFARARRQLVLVLVAAVTIAAGIWGHFSRTISGYRNYQYLRGNECWQEQMHATETLNEHLTSGWKSGFGFLHAISSTGPSHLTYKDRGLRVVQYHSGSGQTSERLVRIDNSSRVRPHRIWADAHNQSS